MELNIDMWQGQQQILAGALKYITWLNGTVIYSSDTTKILKNKHIYTKWYDS